jgi:hypothetical protein
MKRLILNIVLSLIVMLCALVTCAQDSTQNKPAKASVIENEIKNKDFTFVAKWVTPMRGMARQLTSYYDFKIIHDSIIADLPYFGQSYSAPIDPTKISIDLSSTILEYTVTKRKKHEWDIVIKPTNQTDVQSFLLSVFDNGTAYLNITSTNRDPISYNGELEEKQ